MIKRMINKFKKKTCHEGIDKWNFCIERNISKSTTVARNEIDPIGYDSIRYANSWDYVCYFILFISKKKKKKRLLDGCH